MESLAGAISETDVIVQIWVLLLGGLGSAYVLDRWSGHELPVVTAIAIFGALVSYIYSAPPIKLKKYGWLGNYALGSSYISFPWWAGQVRSVLLFADDMCLVGCLWKSDIRCDGADGALFDCRTGHCHSERFQECGRRQVNTHPIRCGLCDRFRELGLQSLPVAFGMEKAKWICVASIDVTQLCVAAYLYFGLEEKTNALILLGLILPQIFFQIRYFLPDPVKNDVRYQASAQPFFVFGLLTTAIALGHRPVM